SCEVGAAARRSAPPTGPPRGASAREGPAMGMPSIAYSFYPLLYNLAAPSRCYHKEAVEAVGPFSLLAFVLCTPHGADGVREGVPRQSSSLDIATADRLLFYAPVDEPPEWRRQRQADGVGRPLFRFYDFIRYPCRSNDPQTTAHSLAVSLGLDL